MLYKFSQTIKLFFISQFILLISLSAYAAPLTLNDQQVQKLAQDAGLQLFMPTTPELTQELNSILQNNERRNTWQQAFANMQNYDNMIKFELQKRNMPYALLAIPVLESRYLIEKLPNNSAQPAGLWQMIPSTARVMGLEVTRQHDERYLALESTQAALNYLEHLYEKFPNWGLVILGYKMGGDNLEDLIKSKQTKNAWDILNAKADSNDTKEYFLAFCATVILLNHPELLKDSN